MPGYRQGLACCLVLFGLTLVGSARAQSPQALGGILTAVPRPSPYPADWQSTPTLANMLIVNSGTPVTCNMEALLTSDKGSGGSTPKFQNISTGSTNFDTPHITNWSMNLTGKVREGFERTGRLPDGTYVLTVHCFNVQSQGTPLPDFFASTTFNVSVPQPPSLLNPSNESVVVAPKPVFQWAPSLRASGSQPAYRFRLVDMLPGQTPLRAIEGNYPLVEVSIENATALSYPLSGPLLTEGHRYAWRVQAIEPPSPSLPPDILLPVGTNQGKSQVFTFTWHPTTEPAGGRPDRLGESPAPPPSPSPRAGSLRNFADRLVDANAVRWRRSRSRTASFALAAATDSIGGLTEAPADTASPLTPLPTDTPPPTVPSEPGTMGQTEVPGMGPQWLRLHGNAAVTGETYSHDGSGFPTRPFHSRQVTTELSFGLLGDRVRVPLDALVSEDQVSFRQNINQVALHPQFSWAGLQAGHFSPQFSTYTLADATLLGAGFELTPRKWRIGFADGTSRKAIEPVPGVAVQPQFARRVLAGRIGYGDPSANTMEVSVLRAKDDRNSLSAIDTTLEATAEANTVYGLKTQGVLPRRHLRAQIETALSIYDRDQRADNPNLKGTALGVKLFRETALTSLGVSYEVLEGGFLSLGNSGIVNDRQAVGVTGRAQLMGGKLWLNANAGWRNDNVSHVMLAETERRDYTLNATWQPRPSFGTDFLFGFGSCDVGASIGASDSVAGSSNITRIVAFSPHVSYVTRGIRQSITGSATIQSSGNTTTAPVPLTSTHGVTLGATWTAAITPVLALNLAGNYTRTDLGFIVSEVGAFGPGFVWSLQRYRIATSAQLDLTRSRTGNFGTDTEFAPRCEVRWQTAPRHAFVARGHLRRYRYAVGVPELDERLFSLEYGMTL